jgi:hypothetical protein
MPAHTGIQALPSCDKEGVDTGMRRHDAVVP